MKADGVPVRLVTDYSDRLNPCIAQEHHGFTCARDIRNGLDTNAKFYCVLNLPHAYFQIPLTPAASKLAAFIATCEIEELTIMQAIKKCRYFLEGLPHFEVYTDHRPLESMYKMDLREVSNTGIHNFREKTAHCHLKVIWTAGKSHLIADTLSRAPATGTFKDGEPPAEYFVPGC